MLFAFNGCILRRIYVQGDLKDHPVSGHLWDHPAFYDEFFSPLLRQRNPLMYIVQYGPQKHTWLPLLNVNHYVHYIEREISAWTASYFGMF